MTRANCSYCDMLSQWAAWYKDVFGYDGLCDEHMRRAMRIGKDGHPVIMLKLIGHEPKENPIYCYSFGKWYEAYDFWTNKTPTWKLVINPATIEELNGFPHVDLEIDFMANVQ